jgi:hypothetical protein
MRKNYINPNVNVIPFPFDPLAISKRVKMKKGTRFGFLLVGGEGFEPPTLWV